MAASDGGYAKPDLMFQKEDEIISEEEFKTIVRNYDTVICNTDILAYELIKMTKRYGVRVPEDLMVAGGYNTIWSSCLGLQITTLTQNPAELSRKAFEILDAGGIHHELVLPEIIERESTARIAPKRESIVKPNFQESVRSTI